MSAVFYTFDSSVRIFKFGVLVLCLPFCPFFPTKDQERTLFSDSSLENGSSGMWNDGVADALDDCEFSLH